MKKILTFLVRLLCLSLLCGQVLAQGTMLNVNSQSKNPLNKRTPPPISKDKEIIKVIDSIYNPAGTAQGYNQKMQCWLLREGNDAIYCMKLVQTITVKPEGLPASTYVVLAGSQYDRQFKRVDYHAASGMVGLVKMGATSGGVTQVAYDKAIPAGSWGDAPESIVLFQAGPLGRMGWAIESSYMGQGYLEGGINIYVPFGNAVARVGGVLTVSNNEGACSAEDAKSQQCVLQAYEAYVTADVSRSEGLLYPLIANVKNEINGKVTRKRVEIPFSIASDRYVPPENMKESLN